MKTFLHILLGIGKVLLIVLLVVVCLIAAILLIPFGYRARIRKDEEMLDVRGRVSWLFVVLRADVHYIDKAVDYEVRLFGIPLVRLVRWFKGLREKRDARRASRPERGTEKDRAEAPSEGPRKTDAEVSSADAGSAGTEQQTGAAKKPSVAPGRVTEETFRGSDDTGNKKTEEDRQERSEHGPSFFARAKEVIHAFVRRIRLIWEKVREGYLLIKSPSFRRAVGQLKKRVLKILRHVRPRRIRGSLRFGFEDPSVTGKLLAALSWIYPSIPRGLALEPVFTDKTLDADVDIRGHVILIVLLVQAIALLIDKDVRKLFSGVMKKKAPSSGAKQ